MPQYKVGDTVIVKDKHKCDLDMTPSWVGDMDHFIGKKCIIQRFGNTGNLGLKLATYEEASRSIRDTWWFNPSWVIPAERGRPWND